MSENTESPTYFSRCRCCLNYGYLKYMWSEHLCEGEVEIYGEMLIQCFALAFEQSDYTMEDDQICETCIIKLREANNFKKAVLDAQDELLKQSVEEGTITPKIEKDIENTDPVEVVMVYQSSDEQDANDGDQVPEANQTADDELNDAQDQMEYEEVEFLDEELRVDEKDTLEATVIDPIETSSSQSSNTDEKPPVKKTKWPKKLPNHLRYKTYKQYTSENLKKCLQAVANDEMTPLEASEAFKIPKKTIVAKVKKLNKTDQDPNKQKTYDFIQEVKSILTYTNATPFKSKANRYHCAYCSSDGPIFEDPNDLRTHTRTLHIDDRTNRIEFAMRPHWLHEVFKLDIDNLLCVVCCLPLTDWNDLFRHLRVQHKVFLDQAYTKLLPYVLTDRLQCALCKNPFTNYMQLDAHMNAHYDNYICDDCGATFVSSFRLKQHTKIHMVGKYRCSFCAKVFTLDKYRKKHEDYIHRHVSKFKCAYCPEKFTSEYLRHLHVVAEHNDRVVVRTCEVCGKTFTWRPFYAAHMKKHASDSDAPTFECLFCGRAYEDGKQFEAHLPTHYED